MAMNYPITLDYENGNTLMAFLADHDWDSVDGRVVVADDGTVFLQLRGSEGTVVVQFDKRQSS